MKVYRAIGAVSRTMAHEGISKARNNQQQGYKFRGIDDVLNALSAALVSAGLVILPRCVEREVVERTTAKGNALFYVTCKVEFDLVSTEDGSKHTVATYGEAMDSADKATNKAMSAAYKYLALLTFCIPTEASAETDADFTTPEPVKPLPPKVVISATDGAADALTEDARYRMDEVALLMIENHHKGDTHLAADIWYADDTFADNDERTYLWSRLKTESKLRAAIKDDPRAPSNRERKTA